MEVQAWNRAQQPEMKTEKDFQTRLTFSFAGY
jgi:hypothetical protein